MTVFTPAPAKQQATWTALALAALLAIHFLTRWHLATSPFLSVPDYDESVTGLMALHFLRGDWVTFFWGQPYMGTLEPFLASLAFRLFPPSILTMRLALVALSSLTLLFIYATGREVGGRGVGFLAGLFWALPPVFLSFDGLYVTGGHLESVTAGVVFLYGTCRLAFRPPPRPALWALGMGVAAGVGFWCSLLVAPMLAACLIGLLVARPALLKGRVPWVLAAGFLLGSAPLWWWNLNHDFMTFKAIENGSKGLLGNLLVLFQGVWLRVLTGAWWDGYGVIRFIPWPLRAVVVALVYLPVLGLLLAAPLAWAARLYRRQAPLSGPRDLIVGVAWAVMLAHAASAYGHTGVTRYSETLLVPLACLAAWWLGRAWAWRKAAGGALLVLLLGYNLATHALFSASTPPHPLRSTSQVVAKLQELGLTRALAHGRMAFPITFMSGEAIICADYFGWRNYSYLKAVEQASQVAILTHDEMAQPEPGELASSLGMMGAQSQRGKVGGYHFWHHFAPPPPTRPLAAAGWRMAAYSGEKGLERALADREQATSWMVPTRAGTWISLDLGRTEAVAGLTLLAATGGELRPLDPVALRVETSGDGLQWETAREGVCLTGMGWRGGLPWVDEVSALEIRFPQRQARLLRITFNLHGEAKTSWPLAEVFLHAPAQPDGFAPPGPALEALALAEQLMEPFFAEPTGPHPRFPGVPRGFRDGKVDWPRVLAALRRAALAAPDWAEPQKRLALALGLAGQDGHQPWPDPRALVLEKGEAIGLPWGRLAISGQGTVKLGYGLGGESVRVEPGRPWTGTPTATQGQGAGGLVTVQATQGQICLRQSGEAWNAAEPGAWAWLAAHPAHVFPAAAMAAGGLAPTPHPQADSGLALELGPERARSEVKVWFPYFLQRGRYLVAFKARGAAQEKPLATFALVRHFLNRVHDQPTSLAWSATDAQGPFQEIILPLVNDLEPARLEAKVIYHGPGKLEIEEISLRPDPAWPAWADARSAPSGPTTERP